MKTHFNILWINSRKNISHQVANPFRKIGAIKSMLRKLYRRRCDQESTLKNMKAERDAKQKLSASACFQRALLNELDGFPTAAVDSENHRSNLGLVKSSATESKVYICYH